MAINGASFIFFILFSLVPLSFAQDYYNNNDPHPIYTTSSQYKPVVKEMKKYGPYGSILPQNYEFELNEGESFSEIHVRHDHMVDAVGFLVSKPDQSTYRVQFGGDGGVLTRIVLENGEYLTRISGKYGYDTVRNYVAIGTLTVHTNIHPEGYGPFGLAGDIIAANLFEFQSPKNVGGPIVGFFGRSNILLESIGIIVRKESY
ncbi:unnamed protein product [Amaranthus hypochondriacus]